MITKVEVRNPQDDLLSLTLDDISDMYVVLGIDGLDPSKATMASSAFALLDGAVFQASRREPRNILLTLGLEPDYDVNSVRDLRVNLYRWFMTKAVVKLRFFTAEGLTTEIVGRVESFETPLFARDPQVVISMLCYDPDFIELAPITYSGHTVSDTTEFLIPYEGSVETGLVFTLNLDRTETEFTIYHRPPDGVTRTMDVTISMLAADVLVISTVAGDKRATLTRTGTASSVLYAISPQATWFELMPGDNHFRVFATGAAIPFTLQYTPRHGGL